MSCNTRRDRYLLETGRTDPLLPRHLPARKTLRDLPKTQSQILKTAIGRKNQTPAELAEGDGYAAGFHNRHYSYGCYRTGEEWIAWYKGWKRGQKERGDL